MGHRPYYPFPSEALLSGRPLVIYGTGAVAEQYMDHLEAIGMRDKVHYFANTFPSERQYFRGVSILDQQQINQLINKQQYTYVVASYWASLPIVDALRACGVDEAQIVMPMPMEQAGRPVYYPFHKRAIRHIVVYPQVMTNQEREDIESRLQWYLPKRQNLRIYLPRDLPDNHQWKNEMDACDLILVWDQESLNDEQLLAYRAKIGCGDPKYLGTPEALLFARLYYRTLEYNEREALLTRSMLNFERLRTQFSSCEHGYVFAPGPSLESILNMQFMPGVKVICNSIIQNRSLLDKIKPDIFVALDALCFSYSEFGQIYIESIRNFLSDSSRYCIVPEMYAALLLAHYPELGSQVIGMPVTSSVFNFPSMNSFSIKSTANVVTTLGIPVASSFAKTIWVAGCDGKAKEEKQWSYSRVAPLNNTLSKVEVAHTSYLQLNQGSATYYERHNRLFEEIIEYGEKEQGRTYHSLTPSFICALAIRQFVSSQ